MVPRDLAAERELTALAALAAGLSRPGPDGRPIGDTRGLDDFADQRCHPGGVRVDLDPLTETREELADARNYIVWGLLRLRPGYLAGDAEIGEAYARLLRALSHVVQAWDALHA